MMIFIFSRLILKEKLTSKKISAIVISFIGIIFIATQGNFSDICQVDFSGACCCLAGSVCYGLFCVLVKKCEYDEVLLLCIAYFVTMIFSGIMCFMNGTFTWVSSVEIAGILWNGIVVHGAAYLWWAIGLNRGDTAQISNMVYLTPFLSIIFGKIILNEDVTVWAFLGILLIAMGIVFQIIKKPSLEHNKSTF